ncbi:MAG: hypothetical protein HXY23_11540 [Parvularculaceae bacterium]|nr:hypothetical protein [Parvularculaceae bacterium]
MIDDEPGGGRRFLGVIDGTLTQAALAVVLVPSTMVAVLFRPKLLALQLDDIQDDGRRGLVLAPGPFFALGFVSFLILASFQKADGWMISLGERVTEATSAGEFWTTVLLVAPLFLVALGLGLIFLIAANIWRLERRSLMTSLRAGLYALFGVACVLIFGEALSGLVGDMRANGSFEPAVAGLVLLWVAYFHLEALSARPDPLIARLGAALTAAAICAGAVTLIYN